MKYIICLSMMFSLSGCFDKVNKEKKEIRIEEIVCKHPRGHILVYKVSGEEASLPFNFRGGVWSFITIDGRNIKTANCHLETIVN